MIAEFQCNKCGNILEEYFATYELMLKEIDSKICQKCNSKMVKIFGRPNVRMGGEIPGYERENENNLTFGKAIDMHQKWV